MHRGSTVVSVDGALVPRGCTITAVASMVRACSRPVAIMFRPLLVLRPVAGTTARTNKGRTGGSGGGPKRKASAIANSRDGDEGGGGGRTDDGGGDGGDGGGGRRQCGKKPTRVKGFLNLAEGQHEPRRGELRGRRGGAQGRGEKLTSSRWISGVSSFLAP